MTPPALPNPVITVGGDLHFTAPDGGSLHVLRSFAGGYILNARKPTTTGVSIAITTADLADIGAWFAQLAAADKR